MVGGRRRPVRAVFAVLVMVAGVLVGAPAALASADSGAVPVRAVFGTTVVRLADGWGAARSCVVFSRASVRCYASNAQADAALGYEVPPSNRTP